MDESSKILLVGGVVSLTYGFALGIPMAIIRTRRPQAPRHLVNAHLEAIIEVALLIALSIATEFSSLATPFETVAALLLVAGCVLSVAGSVANWLMTVDDPFAARSFGWKLQAASATMVVTGVVIILVGVLTAL